MPQEFCVLKCFSCSTFQVHIVKKSSKKWACKMCGEKQTIIKLFGQGSAKDCREHVQKLNMCKGLSEQCSTQDNQKCDKDVGEHIRYEQTIQEGNLGLEDPIDFHEVNTPQSSTKLSTFSTKTSKWDCFLDSESEEN